MEKENNKSNLGFLEILQLAFIIMKVADVINWSWWLVFIPTYIGIVVAIVVIMFSTLYPKFLRKVARMSGRSKAK